MVRSVRSVQGALLFLSPNWTLLARLYVRRGRAFKLPFPFWIPKPLPSGLFDLYFSSDSVDPDRLPKRTWPHQTILRSGGKCSSN